MQRDEDDVEALAQLGGHAAGGLGPHEGGGDDAAHALGAIGQRFLDGAGVVAARQRHPRLLGQRGHGVAAHDPPPVMRDADGDDVVTALLEGGNDGRGRGE